MKVKARYRILVVVLIFAAILALCGGCFYANECATFDGRHRFNEYLGHVTVDGKSFEVYECEHCSEITYYPNLNVYVRGKLNPNGATIKGGR